MHYLFQTFVREGKSEFKIWKEKFGNFCQWKNSFPLSSNIKGKFYSKNEKNNRAIYTHILHKSRVVREGARNGSKCVLYFFSYIRLMPHEKKYYA